MRGRPSAAPFSITPLRMTVRCAWLPRPDRRRAAETNKPRPIPITSPPEGHIMDPRNELAERVFGRRLRPTTQRCSEVGQAFSPVNTQVIDLRHVGQVDDLPWVAHNARYIL